MNKSGKYIERLRKKAGLTQKEMSEKLNISQPYISALETGKHGISLSGFIEMCIKLKVPINEVLI